MALICGGCQTVSARAKIPIISDAHRRAVNWTSNNILWFVLIYARHHYTQYTYTLINIYICLLQKNINVYPREYYTHTKAQQKRTTEKCLWFRSACASTHSSAGNLHFIFINWCNHSPAHRCLRDCFVYAYKNSVLWLVCAHLEPGYYWLWLAKAYTIYIETLHPRARALHKMWLRTRTPHRWFAGARMPCADNDLIYTVIGGHPNAFSSVYVYVYIFMGAWWRVCGGVFVLDIFINKQKRRLSFNLTRRARRRNKLFLGAILLLLLLIAFNKDYKLYKQPCNMCYL